MTTKFYKLPEHVFNDNSLTDTDRRIYMIIADLCINGGYTSPLRQSVADKLGIDKRSVRRCVSNLIQKNYLERNGYYLRVKE